MPKVKAEAKWIENVHSVVGNIRAYSTVYYLSVATGGGEVSPIALRRVTMGARGKSKSLYMK